MAEQSEVRNGRVKWFNNQKGYGFLEDLNGAEDCFVHFTTIKSGGFKSLEEGEEVTYTREKSPKGWTTVEVFRKKRRSDEEEG